MMLEPLGSTSVGTIQYTEFVEPILATLTALGDATFAENVELTISESVAGQAGEAFNVSVAVVLQAAGQALDTLVSTGSFDVGLSDQAQANEAIALGLSLALTDTATASGAFTLARTAELVDTLRASGTLNPYLEASGSLAFSAAVADALVMAMQGDLTGTAETAMTISALATLYQSLSDAAVNSLVVNNVVELRVALTDAGVAADISSAYATLVAALQETGAAAISISLGGVEYVGYVVNAETGAVTTYSNFPFTGLARVGDSVFACSESGLYQLGGDTDAGAAIQARFATGLLDFGSRQLKRLESAALGYSSDGTLVMKVSGSQAGAAKERWYKLKPQTADYPREGVIKTAKGPQSRYWKFELENVDGANFELVDFTLYPVALNRRR